VQLGDSPQLRKQRGAFFTPYPIAEYLAEWALRGATNGGVVLDPTCGEGVFLLAAANRLAAHERTGHLIGIDVHQPSLDETADLLGDAGGSKVELLEGDFFNEARPDQLGARLPYVDAVIGNPPFVRYQEHRGDARKRAASAAFAQGVRLSGLASSWAALLVHSSAFLKPDGRIAMVLPAELLSVGYAEPIRRWLRSRFQAVHLVLFEELQFVDAEEQVVLLIARGTGGCNAFSLHHVRGAADLSDRHVFDADAFAPQATGKWTELLVQEDARGLLRTVLETKFEPLSAVARSELGTVTGGNSFFTMNEDTRLKYSLKEERDVIRTVPPGTRHVKGVTFTMAQWEQLRDQGDRVWLLYPKSDKKSAGLARYVDFGEANEVDKAYKCTIREPWWRPPVVSPPDMFFTYMSHVSPRLVRNEADVTFLNSMHGVRLLTNPSAELADMYSILTLNTVTRLGAEIFGRSYGGGILKMEPTEAAQLPVPRRKYLDAAWAKLKKSRSRINSLIQEGAWDEATDLVDDVLLRQVSGVSNKDLAILSVALKRTRLRRQRRSGDGKQG